MKKIITVLIALSMLMVSAFASNAEITEYSEQPLMDASPEEIIFEEEEPFIEVAEIEEIDDPVVEVAVVEAVEEDDYQDGDGAGETIPAVTGTGETPVTPGEKPVIVGSAVILPTPVKEGFSFVEWNTEKDGTGVSYKGGDSIAFEQLNFLFAIWNPVSETEAASEKTQDEAPEGVLAEGAEVTAQPEETVPDASESKAVGIPGEMTEETAGLPEEPVMIPSESEEADAGE